MFQVGLITKDGLEPFKTLLLKDVRTRFAKDMPVLALGLTEEDAEGKHIPCGAAAGWIEGASFVIYSFYVALSHRRHGGGRMLMETLCGLLSGSCEDVDFSYTTTKEDHETLAPFLKALRFTKDEDERTKLYIATLEEISREPFFVRIKPGATVPGVIPFESIPPRSFDSISQLVKTTGDGRDMPSLPADFGMDNQISMALLKGTLVRSFAAFARFESGLVSLVWMRSEQPQDAPMLLKAAYAALKGKYPDDTLISIQTITPNSQALIAHLLPQARNISFSWYRYLDAEQQQPDMTPERTDISTLEMMESAAFENA